jgi:hypothetical protein
VSGDCRHKFLGSRTCALCGWVLPERFQPATTQAIVDQLVPPSQPELAIMLQRYEAALTTLSVVLEFEPNAAVRRTFGFTVGMLRAGRDHYASQVKARA